MATQAERDLAREMFNFYATGFDPGEAGIDFWANKIATQGFDSTMAEFINPPQGQSAPRFNAMMADPDYMAAISSDNMGAMLNERTFRNNIRQSVAQDQNLGGTYVADGRGNIVDAAGNIVGTDTGGGATNVTTNVTGGGTNTTNTATPAFTAQDLFDYYVTGYTPTADALAFWNNKIATMSPEAVLNEFLNPSDLYAPRTDVMFADPDYIRAGGKGRPATTVTGGGGNDTFKNNTNTKTQTDSTATTTKTTTTPTTPGTSTVTTVTPPGSGVTTPPLTQEGMMTYGGLNFFGTPLQGGYYSETGFEPTFRPFGGAGGGQDAASMFATYATGFTPDATALNFWNNKIATQGYQSALNEFLNPSDVNAPRTQTMYADPQYLAATGRGPVGMGEPGAIGGGMAQSLFNQYATGFTPDQAALDFWNSKIATLGYQGALNEFLNPSDINAPRNAAMFADPNYAFARSGIEAGFSPPAPIAQGTFRSGVAGYTPLAPTGFQFGVAPVTAPRYAFTPGVFNPGYINEAGEWFPTAPGEAAPNPMAPGTIRTGNRANEPGSEYEG